MLDPACPGEWHTQTPTGLRHTNGSPNLGQKTRPSHQKKRTWKIVDFAVPAGHWVRLKESEKKDKYFYLAREWKKLWNMMVTIIPIVIGAFGTVIKGLLKELGDLEIGSQEENIQTTALLRSARILRRVLETCYLSNSSERLSANTDMKNSQGVNNNNDYLEDSEIGGGVETIQTTALLRSARILRRVLKTWDLLSFRLQ